MIPVRYTDGSFFTHVGALIEAARWENAAAQLSAGVLERGTACAVLPLNSGRAALMLALEAMQSVRQGQRTVVVPEYVCPSVVAAVRRVGLEVRVAPVSRDLNLDVARLGEFVDAGVLAVIAVHCYGYPVDVGAVQAAVSGGQTYVVDDAAHCLPPPASSAGAGMGGSAGVFSFALSKAISNGYSGRGGVLIISDAALRDYIDQWWDRAPRGATTLWDDVYFLLTCHGESWFDQIPWRWRSRVLALLSSRSVDPWRSARISERDAALALIQMSQGVRQREERLSRIAAVLSGVPDTDRYWFPHRSRPDSLSRLALCLRSELDESQVADLGLKVGMKIRMGYPPLSDRKPRSGTVLEVPLGARWTRARIARLMNALARISC